MTDISITQEDANAAEQRENEMLQQVIQQHKDQRLILVSAELEATKTALSEANAKVEQYEAEKANSEQAEIARLSDEANASAAMNGHVVGEVVASE